MRAVRPACTLRKWAQYGTRYSALTCDIRRGFVSFVALMSVLGPDARGGDPDHRAVHHGATGSTQELRNGILSVTSHATAEQYRRLRSPEMAPGAAGLAEATGRRGGGPLHREATVSMLANGVNMAGATVRGVLPEEERKATGLARQLLKCRVPRGSRSRAVPGDPQRRPGAASCAQALGTRQQMLVLIAPEEPRRLRASSPRMRRFQVTGIFQSGITRVRPRPRPDSHGRRCEVIPAG